MKTPTISPISSDTNTSIIACTYLLNRYISIAYFSSRSWHTRQEQTVA